MQEVRQADVEVQVLTMAIGNPTPKKKVGGSTGKVRKPTQRSPKTAGIGKATQIGSGPGSGERFTINKRKT